MGMNGIDQETRLAARAILGAEVKFPYRSILNKIEKIKTAEDKYQILTLNSWVPEDTNYRLKTE